MKILLPFPNTHLQEVDFLPMLQPEQNTATPLMQREIGESSCLLLSQIFKRFTEM